MVTVAGGLEKPLAIWVQPWKYLQPLVGHTIDGPFYCHVVSFIADQLAIFPWETIFSLGTKKHLVLPAKG